jgi:predicted amidohydrolase
MRVACVQMRSGVDRHQNISTATALIDRAAADGARFVLTPEMTNAVDRNAERLKASLRAESAELELEVFANAARRNAIWLVVGSIATFASTEGETRTAEGVPELANRTLAFSPDGALIATYDKIHMFDVQLSTGETWKESNVYQAGGKAVVIDTGVAKAGLSICYDVRFAQLYRKLAQAGADILCVPAAFTKPTGKAHWETLLRARAIECGAYVMASAQGGQHEDGRETWGHSMIVSPWGDVLACLDHDEPDILVADINLSDVAAVRRQIPSLSLEISPEILNVGG